MATNKMGKVFAVGWLVSFLGSLPLGTMNIAAIRIAVYDGTWNAFIYSFGSLVAELLYVRLVLVAMHWVRTRYKLFRFLEWTTLLVIVALAVGSLIAATKPAGDIGVYGGHVPHPFLWGLLLSVTNPLHIPFWLGWTTVLVNKNILPATKPSYRFYMIGIGTGTITGFMVFIFGGAYFAQQLKEHQQVMSAVIGVVLLATACIQAYKMMTGSRNAVYNN